MKRTALQWLRRSFAVVVAAGALTACANEAPLGPKGSQVASPMAATQPSAAKVDLASCTNLAVEEGSQLVFRAYAKGVQIYHWNGQAWAFDGPSATLFADAEYTSVVGTHSFGPSWESVSGSKVVGSVLQKCFVDPNSVPWLLLAATPTEGAGVFQKVAYIQRINTVGGNAPSYSGTIGEEARIPYTTEYLFYKAP